MNHRIKLADQPDEELRKAILAPLRAYNESQAGPGNIQTLAIVVENDANEVLGGLWANTAYGWLSIQLLVVPDALRGQGVGTGVLRLAEDEAIQRGCGNAWLDTFEFQARGFYERNGYECFGELPQYPVGYSRYFMRKRLVGGSVKGDVNDR